MHVWREQLPFENKIMGHDLEDKIARWSSMSNYKSSSKDKRMGRLRGHGIASAKK